MPARRGGALLTLLRVLRGIVLLIVLGSAVALVAELGYVKIPGVTFESGAAAAAPRHTGMRPGMKMHMPAKSRHKRPTPHRHPVAPTQVPTRVPTRTATPVPTHTPTPVPTKRVTRAKPVHHTTRPARVEPRIIAVSNSPRTAIIGQTERFSVQLAGMAHAQLIYILRYPNGMEKQAIVYADKHGYSSYAFPLTGYTLKQFRVEGVQIRVETKNHTLKAAKYFAIQRPGKP